MVNLKDVKLSDSSFEYGLTLLTGKKIKEVRGYFGSLKGEVAFTLTNIEFEDGTMVCVEGEHDFPYLTVYSSQPQPNMNDETIERLYRERRKEDGEDD